MTPSTRTRQLLAATILTSGAILGPQAAGIAAAAPSCPDVDVVFARGTFEAPGVGATGQAFVDALNSRLQEPVGVSPVSYPASLDFQEAASGVVDATNQIESLAQTCPNTKIVVGGYSQGAAVAGYAVTDAVPAGYALPAGITGPMPASVAPHIAAVVLFGTPSPGVLGLLDNEAPPIAVGAGYAPKTLQLCAQGDPVCYPGGLDRSAHSSYKSNGMADQAAAFVVSKLGTGAIAAETVSAIQPG